MKSSVFTRSDYQATADLILSHTTLRPTIGLVLGSGLGDFARAVEDAVTIPYSEIPSWPRSTVQGHHGNLIIGRIEGQTVLVLQGRVHLYEGYTMQEVTFPIRVMQMIGIKTLIVTNAAGGLNTSFSTGDLMLITDHINLPGMTGGNPLIGPNDESLGPRFPPMTTIYDIPLGNLARRVASEVGFTLREGVYVSLSGPSFETPAETRMLRLWGGDAVGMSTAPETVVARHANMRVLGISVITNMVIDNPNTTQQVGHDEVIETGKRVASQLIALIRGMLASVNTV
jgi:purine-nucleoside phosphorylase